ncbi:hypothetical protein DUI87_21986 [Hirundo rustica rustica]|uniref:Keratin n=2 Tax=Hirundo rustica TaxID=43150 RepID=A0A3M0JLG6_HIRRU|nr:hypothetical protein DUI87_21986 [Hirundo rustica rustica]
MASTKGHGQLGSVPHCSPITTHKACGRAQVLADMQAWHHSRHEYRVGDEFIETRPVKKDLGALVDENLSQQFAFASQKANGILGCITKGITGRLRAVILLIYSDLMRPPHLGSECSLKHKKDMDLLDQVHLQPQDMSCNTQCRPCQPCGPTPLANSCNEPCVRQCQNSTVVIEPPAVLVTLPGPILSSFPQNTVVGSSTSAAVGNILSCDGVPINSGGFDISCITRRYGGNRCRPC